MGLKDELPELALIDKNSNEPLFPANEMPVLVIAIDMGGSDSFSIRLKRDLDKSAYGA